VRLSGALRRSALVGAQEDARIALLEGLIDHAPLFPPASLGLADALAEDRRARESPAAFALGRFVCPASLVLPLGDSERALSVVVDRELGEDERFPAIEAPFRDDLDALAGHAPEVYVEVPLDDRLEARLDAISAHGFRAKVRCGGAAVPGPEELAQFVRRCRERGLAFKATAGLHHAVRTGGAHGLLNLLAAVVFEDVEEALLEEEPDAFRLDRDIFGWRGWAASGEEVARARRDRLRAIGSCSFFEPIEELEGLRMLPRELLAR
jgi:hypothetical protein